ncbi:MAG: hypothetical protein F9K31_08840, partial [Dokdonella sp.]
MTSVHIIARDNGAGLSRDLVILARALAQGGFEVSVSAIGAGGLRLGPEKCVFIYNANGNRFRDNWFEGCAIGVHFTAGSEG